MFLFFQLQFHQDFDFSWEEIGSYIFGEGLIFLDDLSEAVHWAFQRIQGAGDSDVWPTDASEVSWARNKWKSSVVGTVISQVEWNFVAS